MTSSDVPLPQTPDPAAAALDDPLRRIDVVVGDLTDPDPAWGLDAIVNAANESLLGGSGVDGAIHRAAGPELLGHCRALGGCPTGLAKATPAFDLEARGVRHVFHAVGPVWPPEYRSPSHAMPGAPLGEDAKLGYLREDTLLASCYLNALRLAEQHGVAGLGFPAISTGVYGFPKPRAAKIAFGHVFGHYARRPAPAFPAKVWFVCFREEDAAVYRDAIQNRADWMTNRSRI
ncbi:MAG: macro domain-containing protein [Planctomycetota bacterium]